ncbi:MAG: hypothetical protein WB676_17645 [Bryobacteraceae bacterium]
MKPHRQKVLLLKNGTVVEKQDLAAPEPTEAPPKRLESNQVQNQEPEPLPENESELSPTGHRILKHWREFRPKYVQSLEQKNQLYQSVEQAAIDHWQTFSQAKSIGLAYDQAQELAREGWIHPVP